MDYGRTLFSQMPEKREFYQCNQLKTYYLLSKPNLTLSLFMTWISTNNPDNPISSYYLTVATHFFNRCSYFHNDLINLAFLNDLNLIGQNL